MDSCYIFNFLFGSPRKATSELRKCFTAASGKSDKSQKSSQATADSSRPKQQGGCPKSPLKQIQLKLASLSVGGGSKPSIFSLKTHEVVSPSKEPLRGLDRDLDLDSDEEIQLEFHSELHAQIPDHDANLVCGIFEAQLVKLRDDNDDDHHDHHHDHHHHHQDEHEQKSCSLAERQAKSVDENNNIRSEFGVLNENPANKSETRRKNLYENPLNQKIHTSTQHQANNDQFQPKRVPREETPSQHNEDQKRPFGLEDKRRLSKSERVRNLVQSFEITTRQEQQYDSSKPTTPIRLQPLGLASPRRSLQNGRLVKPPDTPPKSNRAKCLNWQLILNKPARISILFQDETFLTRHFFDKLEPIDRCSAAQVCRQWRNLLYANKDYWKDLVGVIDCTQLRREHLVECIMNTLHSAKLKQQQLQMISSNGGNNPLRSQHHNHHPHHHHNINVSHHHHHQDPAQTDPNKDICELDQDEVWRIQELCNRFTARGQFTSSQKQTPNQNINNQRASMTSNSSSQDQNDTTTATTTQQNTTTTTTSGIANSKSSSSQISSSTLSSVSISSLLSPLSESSRIDSIREKLYMALDERGFDAVCLFGAADEDIEELASKTRPNGAQRQIRVGRLSNCSVSDRGLEVFVSNFAQIEELELTGCNEITNNIDLRGLARLKRLIITDCVNIADGFAQRLIEIIHQLDELILQAYHLTDTFLEYVSLNADMSQLKRLELPNCKEITNDSALVIAKHFQALQCLSISGSTKINDYGVERMAERLKRLAILDLGWLKIGDYSLECLACDARDLQELVLDRNPLITDVGVAYLASLSNLSALYVRWCPQLTDKSIRSISCMRSLKRLSLAGLHQVTARGILSLMDAQQLEELELTNCPAVTCDLQKFLATKMPNCSVVY